jgi:hypothetical protein
MTTYDDLCDSVAERITEEMDLKSMCVFVYETLFEIYMEDAEALAQVVSDLDMWEGEEEHPVYMQILTNKLTEVSDEPN